MLVLKSLNSASLWRLCALLCLVVQACLSLCKPMDCRLPGSFVHGDSPNNNARMGCHALLQGIFPIQDQTQASNIVGRFFTFWATSWNPRILEWVAYPFSRGSSPPRNWTRVSFIVGGFFTSWAAREAPIQILPYII